MRIDSCFFNLSPLSISFDLGSADDEGWRKFGLTLERDRGEAVSAISGALSSQCVARLSQGLEDLLGGRAQRFDYEPMEPAFSLRLETQADGRFRIACIVDEVFAAGGAGTETGVGLTLVADRSSIEALLAALD